MIEMPSFISFRWTNKSHKSPKWGTCHTYSIYIPYHTIPYPLDGILMATRFCSLDNICFGQLATNLF